MKAYFAEFDRRGEDEGTECEDENGLSQISVRNLSDILIIEYLENCHIEEL